ncbi:hypothetical protein D3C78_745420 [compost metagenome]
MRYRIDHLNVELQTGAQADLVKDIGSDAAKLMTVIVKAHGCKVLVDRHPHPWMLLDPAALSGAQAQAAAVEQHPGTAAGPAAQNVQTVVVADAVERLIDQAQYARVVAGHGKGEGAAQVLDEVIDLHAAQVHAGDQVVTADRVAEKRVGLSQRYGREAGQVGAVKLQLGLGVKRGDHRGWQIMIDHRQAQPCKLVVEPQGFP